MHLTVTQWRSLVPMAPKSEVSGMVESVPLETGGKKNNQKRPLCMHHISPSRTAVLFCSDASARSIFLG